MSPVRNLQARGLSATRLHRREYLSMACEPGIVRSGGGRGIFLAHAAGILFAATAMLVPAQIPSKPAPVPNAPAPIPSAPSQTGTAPEPKSPPSVKERFLVDR